MESLLQMKGSMLYKPPMDADAKKELQARYLENIQHLSVLIEKDLSDWND